MRARLSYLMRHCLCVCWCAFCVRSAATAFRMIYISCFFLSACAKSRKRVARNLDIDDDFAKTRTHTHKKHAKCRYTLCGRVACMHRDLRTNSRGSHACHMHKYAQVFGNRLTASDSGGGLEPGQVCRTLSMLAALGATRASEPNSKCDRLTVDPRFSHHDGNGQRWVECTFRVPIPNACIPNRPFQSHFITVARARIAREPRLNSRVHTQQINMFHARHDREQRLG